MFTFGFSYIGIIYLLMLFIPNIIWTKHQPEGYSAEGENKILGIFERIGEVLCTCCAVIFSDFNFHLSEWIIWLGISFLLMIFYEMYWVRYFRSPKTLRDFYQPFLGVSVPGATYPVIAFFLLGIYGTNIFMIISSVILGIGHIGIHLEHYKKLDDGTQDDCRLDDGTQDVLKSDPGEQNSEKDNSEKKNPQILKIMVKAVKIVICAVLAVAFLVLSFFIGARNINYIKHYQLIQKGVDEGIYVELGGIKQYLLIRGANEDNPVIIYLHGGPSSPESYINYSWVDDLTGEYTIIDWDQRGCGRTYVQNEDMNPDNETATFEQAVTDLDELVDYACDRFGQDQVILIGHSYGTVLATEYIDRYSEKVASYVGIAQVVSMDINNHELAEMAISNAQAEGLDDTKIQNALSDFDEDQNVLTTIALRGAAFSYLPSSLSDQSSWMALVSPYMGMDDLKWFFKQQEPLKQYIALNQNLYDSLQVFDLYDKTIPKDLQVTFISGSMDYPCPVSTIEDYIAASGINGTLYTIEDCGHNVQYTKPHEVSQIILDVLK